MKQTEPTERLTGAPKSYRSLLREILVQKQQKNPQFSLRALAKTLGLHSSFLSLVLNGKRHLSEETVGMIAEKLSLSPETSREFTLLLRLEKVKSPLQRSQILQDLKRLRPEQTQIRDLSVDQFKVISEWYHLPLQILCDLDGFEWSEENAAVALGISVHEVKLALERLASLELIEYEEGQKPKINKDTVMVRGPEHYQALKSYHETMLRKNIEALYQQGPEKRLTATLNTALSESQLKKAHAILLAAQKKIIKLAETREPEKELFHVSLNLFQITHTPTTPKRRTSK